MRALERLKASVAMKPTLRTVELPSGEEFTFFAPPITLAQRAKAQKLAGNDDATSFAIQLLVMLAQDENGQKLFAPGEVAELRNELPASVVESLMLQLLQDAAPMEEGEEALDMKSAGGRAAKGQPAAS